jgi:hypothetical protein
VQFHSNRAKDNSDGLGISALLADEFSGVVGMRLDSEGGTAVCDERIDAYELWLVDNFTGNLG